MDEQRDPRASEAAFCEFRRKVKGGELLSASIEKLVLALGFNGRLSIVVQDGKVLKSGYEEGYFSRKNDVRMT